MSPEKLTAPRAVSRRKVVFFNVMFEESFVIFVRIALFWQISKIVEL